MRHTQTWAGNEHEADAGDFDDLDDDEDEFGLPSLGRPRRAQPPRSAQFSPDSEAEARERIDRDLAMLGISKPSKSRGRANSGDISEVREGVAMYPAMKSNEGKLLRPQYKEILKG